MKTYLIGEAKRIAAETAAKFPQYALIIYAIEFRVSYRMTKTMGKAHICPKTKAPLITISVPIFSRMENMKLYGETVLHEIAHHIAGLRHGHNVHWRSIARLIGCSGRTKLPAKTVDNRVKVRCVKCRSIVKIGPIRAKNLNKYYHIRCGGDLIAASENDG